MNNRGASEAPDVNKLNAVLKSLVPGVDFSCDLKPNSDGDLELIVSSDNPNFHSAIQAQLANVELAGVMYSEPSIDNPNAMQFRLLMDAENLIKLQNLSVSLASQFQASPSAGTKRPASPEYGSISAMPEEAPRKTDVDVNQQKKPKVVYESSSPSPLEDPSLPDASSAATSLASSPSPYGSLPTSSTEASTYSNFTPPEYDQSVSPPAPTTSPVSPGIYAAVATASPYGVLPAMSPTPAAASVTAPTQSAASPRVSAPVQTSSVYVALPSMPSIPAAIAGTTLTISAASPGVSAPVPASSPYVALPPMPSTPTATLGVYTPGPTPSVSSPAPTAATSSPTASPSAPYGRIPLPRSGIPIPDPLVTRNAASPPGPAATPSAALSTTPTSTGAAPLLSSADVNRIKAGLLKANQYISRAMRRPKYEIANESRAQYTLRPAGASAGSEDRVDVQKDSIKIYGRETASFVMALSAWEGRNELPKISIYHPEDKRKWEEAVKVVYANDVPKRNEILSRCLEVKSPPPALGATAGRAPAAAPNPDPAPPARSPGRRI